MKWHASLIALLAFASATFSSALDQTGIKPFAENYLDSDIFDENNFVGEYRPFQF